MSASDFDDILAELADDDEAEGGSPQTAAAPISDGGELQSHPDDAPAAGQQTPPRSAMTAALDWVRGLRQTSDGDMGGPVAEPGTSFLDVAGKMEDLQNEQETNADSGWDMHSVNGMAAGGINALTPLVGTKALVRPFVEDRNETDLGLPPQNAYLNWDAKAQKETPGPYAIGDAFVSAFHPANKLLAPFRAAEGDGIARGLLKVAGNATSEGLAGGLSTAGREYGDTGRASADDAKLGAAVSGLMSLVGGGIGMTAERYGARNGTPDALGLKDLDQREMRLKAAGMPNSDIDALKQNPAKFNAMSDEANRLAGENFGDRFLGSYTPRDNYLVAKKAAEENRAAKDVLAEQIADAGGSARPAGVAEEMRNYAGDKFAVGAPGDKDSIKVIEKIADGYEDWPRQHHQEFGDDVLLPPAGQLVPPGVPGLPPTAASAAAQAIPPTAAAQGLPPPPLPAGPPPLAAPPPAAPLSPQQSAMQALAQVGQPPQPRVSARAPANPQGIPIDPNDLTPVRPSAMYDPSMGPQPPSMKDAVARLQSEALPELAGLPPVDPQGGYFLHRTPAENVPQIAKEGLQPRAAQSVPGQSPYVALDAEARALQDRAIAAGQWPDGTPLPEGGLTPHEPYPDGVWLSGGQNKNADTWASVLADDADRPPADYATIRTRAPAEFYPEQGRTPAEFFRSEGIPPNQLEMQDASGAWQTMGQPPPPAPRPSARYQDPNYIPVDEVAPVPPSARAQPQMGPQPPNIDQAIAMLKAQRAPAPSTAAAQGLPPPPLPAGPPPLPPPPAAGVPQAALPPPGPANNNSAALSALAAAGQPPPAAPMQGPPQLLQPHGPPQLMPQREVPGLPTDEVPFMEMNKKRINAGAPLEIGVPPKPENAFNRLEYGLLNDAQQAGANRAGPGWGDQWAQLKRQEGLQNPLAEAGYMYRNQRRPLDRSDLILAGLGAGAVGGKEYSDGEDSFGTGALKTGLGAAAGIGASRFLGSRGASIAANFLSKDTEGMSARLGQRVSQTPTGSLAGSLRDDMTSASSTSLDSDPSGSAPSGYTPGQLLGRRTSAAMRANSSLFMPWAEDFQREQTDDGRASVVERLLRTDQSRFQPAYDFIMRQKNITSSEPGGP